MQTHLGSKTAAIASSESTISEFTVSGMNCQNCVRHVTEAIQGVPGVTAVDVRLAEGRATVRWQPHIEARVAAVVEAVKKAGYDATPVEEQSCHAAPPGDSPMATWKFTLIFGTVLTAPLIIGEWIFGLGAKEWFKW